MEVATLDWLGALASQIRVASNQLKLKPIDYLSLELCYASPVRLGCCNIFLNLPATPRRLGEILPLTFFQDRLAGILYITTTMNYMQCIVGVNKYFALYLVHIGKFLSYKAFHSLVECRQFNAWKCLLWLLSLHKQHPP